MANTYFLNAQDNEISINLNSTVSAHIIEPLTPPGHQSVCMLGLSNTKGENVLGTGTTNSLLVNAGQSNSITWEITMNGILPSHDIQFLIFKNDLMGPVHKKCHAGGKIHFATP